MTKMLLGLAAVLGTVALVSMASAADMEGCTMGKSCCGMSKVTPAAATTQPATQATTYGCSMCKDVKSDKPGKCPHCGMDLVPTTK